MASRRDFLQNTVVMASAMAFSSHSAHAGPGTQTNYLDNLTDDSGKYALQPLPYAYDALEPAIDAHTVELHYNFHHKPAVAGANKAEEALAKARETNDFALIKFFMKKSWPIRYQAIFYIPFTGRT